MADTKPNIEIQKPAVVKSEEAPAVTAVVVDVSPIPTNPDKKRKQGFESPVGPNDRNPSDWKITPGHEDGVIEAVNLHTQNSFYGEPSVFIKGLRG